MESKIVAALNGILGITTLYDLSFSLNSIISSLKLMLDGREYLEVKKSGIGEFMQQLEDSESTEERENRKNKDRIYDPELLKR